MVWREKEAGLKTFIRLNRLFIICYILFVIVGGIIALLFEHGDEIIYFSSLHTPLFNRVFRYITLLGELPFVILVLLYVFLSGYGRGLLLGINMCVVFAVVQFLKHIVFSTQVRPSIFFKGKAPLDFITGVDVLRYNSFPSGHSASAFALFFALSIISKNKWWSIVYFALALLVGVSRVYLLQHFFRDVYFGAMLAVVITLLFWHYALQSKWYNNITWRDKALLT